jgi:hypothetical protein
MTATVSLGRHDEVARFSTPRRRAVHEGRRRECRAVVQTGVDIHDGACNDHPSPAVLNNLASLLFRYGDHASAEPPRRFEIYRTLFDPIIPDRTTMNNLGLTPWRDGNTPDEPLFASCRMRR